MGMLTFRQEFKEKLLNGEKRQTIRWSRQPGEILHIWCPTPRTGRGVKLGSSKRWTQTATRGRDLTDEIARKDGFGSAQDLKQWLMNAHELTMTQVEMKIWYVIEWDWTVGPNGH